MKMNATSKNIIPSVKIEIKLNPYQKSSDCNSNGDSSVQETLKNAVASSWLSGNRCFNVSDEIIANTIKMPNIKTKIR